MIYPIERRLNLEWARKPAALWFGLTLGCLLLAGCVTSGETPSPTADAPMALPKAEPAVARSADVSPASTPARAVLSSPQLLRRRLAIAEMLEETFYYRTIYNIRLFDARLAGPFEHTSTAIFTGASVTSTYYCVSAQLDYPLIPIVKNAMIQVRQSSSGYERLQMSGQSPLVCGNANYGPFPELEQARALRRKALGKTD